MDDDFNWLEYSENLEAAPQAAEAPMPRRGLRRFLPRLPRKPRLRLPSLRRRSSAEAAQTSAAELLADQQEIPLEDLDDRLRALRERSSAHAQSETPAHQALYDVDDILTSPQLQGKPGGIISAASLSQAQQRQVEMLRDIVGGPAQSQSGSQPRLSAFSLSALPRLLATAFMLLLVALPFVSSDFAEGDLPPADFPESRPGPGALYAALNSLSADDYVLVALEYGPAAAGELDMLADLLLRHIFAKRAKPLIISGNPIAIAHARNLIQRINRSLPSADGRLLDGDDYVILRYLPGGALGARELSENFADVARISARGLPTGLVFAGLDDLAEILLIADSAEDIRIWVEQVLPELADPRLLLATGYAAQPLAQAYADSLDQIAGPLVGIRDAYTYSQKLIASYGVLKPIVPTVTKAASPSPTFVKSESQAELPAATSASFDVVLATVLPQPTATPPAATVMLTATPPPTASPMPSDTPAPTATEAMIRVVEITAEQRVNIRLGPTTVHEIVALGYKGDIYEVIGANGDESWYQIALSTGLEAWIAAFLVEERVISASELAGAQANASAEQPAERTILQAEYQARMGKNQPRFYQAQPQPAADRVEMALSRDRSQEAPRLQAMTLGTIAAVLVILIGNALWGLRALLRRRGS